MSCVQGFAVDDPYLHLYTDGRWGTWGEGNTAIGICERPAGVTYQVFVRNSADVAGGGGGGGH